MEVVNQPPPDRPSKESCEIYATAFKKSTNTLGRLIDDQQYLLVKECSTNDTIFTNNGDNSLDIFTANLGTIHKLPDICKANKFLFFCIRETSLMRFFLSYDIIFPFKMANFLPFANAKKIFNCHLA